MSNRGVAPADPNTEIGQLRTNLGDLAYVALDPVETGYGDYEWFSDSELEELLVLAEDNITRATGYGLRKFATYLTMSAVNIQTDDLRVSTIERAKLMRELAKDWLSDADAAEDREGSEIFEVIPFAGLEPTYEAKTWPELSSRPYVL